jgi:glycosyltransferase involved in cell wall biosynthesis
MQNQNKVLEQKDPKVEFLISTMHRTDLQFLTSMFKNYDLDSLHILIVNQTTEANILVSKQDNIRVINVFETGLAKSRNLALKHSKAEIAIIADDDVEYLPDALQIIKTAYILHPDAALISFQYLREDGSLYKLYQPESGYQNHKLHKQSLSSIEISMRPEVLRQHKIHFNTCFGLGARFVCGEEQVLRDDIIRKGLKVAYVAKPIVMHTGKTSVPAENSKAYTQAIVVQKYLQHKNFIYLWLIRYIWKLISRKVIKFSEVGNIWYYGKTAVKDYKANCSR